MSPFQQNHLVPSKLQTLTSLLVFPLSYLQETSLLLPSLTSSLSFQKESPLPVWLSCGQERNSPSKYLQSNTSQNAPISSSSQLAPQERIFCRKYLLPSTRLQMHLLLSARISSLSSIPPLQQRKHHLPNNGLQVFPESPLQVSNSDWSLNSTT